MNILEKFVINDQTLLEITIPALENKINYFYDVTPQLNRFDEVTVTLKMPTGSIILYQNTVDDAFFRLRSFLNKIVSGKKVIPHKKFIGSVGRYHTIDEYRHWKYEEGGESLSADALEYLDFLLYTSGQSQAWLYSDGHIIYFEVGYAFPLLSSADAPPDDQLFEKFLGSYKPLFFDSISFEQAREWLEKCNMHLIPFEL
jgi:hypothetical protein